jgi:glycosyltransferase involved in cell wall biosynthesis
MRILLANYRYFVSGGPERYMFNVSAALGARGHEVIPFSVRYARNEPTPYARYFVEPLGDADEVRFAEQRATLRALARTLVRLFYDPGVERAVGRLAADTRPEVAYVLHYLRKLSPALLAGLAQAGLPIVVRLSDFGMLCPEQHLLRDGSPCELCLGGSLWPSVRHACVQGSRVASGLNALATSFHRRRRYFDLIDAFVVTTRFMQKKMIDAGFAPERLRWIPTPVDTAAFRPRAAGEREPWVAYAGRLEAIKGVHVLIEAARILRRRRPELRFTVKLAGAGSRDYEARLRAIAGQAELGGVVEFLGELNAPALAEVLGRAAVSVVPSLWYENLPNAVLESHACGTPVLASDHGALSECVADGETGFRFPPGDAEALAERLEFCLDHREETAAMGEGARGVAETDYSPERHVEALEGLFSELRSRSGEAVRRTTGRGSRWT